MKFFLFLNKTALNLAVEKSKIEIVQLLLQNENINTSIPNISNN